MHKIAIYFTNNKGQYYVENTEIFLGDTIPKTPYNHQPALVSDESIEWRNYEKTMKELSNPTTEDNEVFVVVQHLRN